MSNRNTTEFASAFTLVVLALEQCAHHPSACVPCVLATPDADWFELCVACGSRRLAGKHEWRRPELVGRLAELAALQRETSQGAGEPGSPVKRRS
jgi:hypothetical protein